MAKPGLYPFTRLLTRQLQYYHELQYHPQLLARQRHMTRHDHPEKPIQPAWQVAAQKVSGWICPNLLSQSCWIAAATIAFQKKSTAKSLANPFDTVSTENTPWFMVHATPCQPAASGSDRPKHGRLLAKPEGFEDSSAIQPFLGRERHPRCDCENRAEECAKHINKWFQTQSQISKH